AATPVDGAACTYTLQFEFDLLDAMRDAAAVGFQLRLAGSASTDAAAQPRHLDTTPRQAWQQVIELRQFDLEAAFARAGTRGENVEDQLSAVDDPGAHRFLEVALLGRREFAIENDDVRRPGTDVRRQFS